MKKIKWKISKFLKKLGSAVIVLQLCTQESISVCCLHYKAIEFWGGFWKRGIDFCLEAILSLESE